jgi:hypothetical protein
MLDHHFTDVRSTNKASGKFNENGHILRYPIDSMEEFRIDGVASEKAQTRGSQRGLKG